MNRRKARDRRHRRVRKKIVGTPERPRLSVYKSNKYIYAQVIDDAQGVTLASASSQEKAMRSKPFSVGTAAEVGKALADRAKDAGVSAVVFDRGGYPYHGRVRALADSARESGLEF